MSVQSFWEQDGFDCTLSLSLLRMELQIRTTTFLGPIDLQAIDPAPARDSHSVFGRRYSTVTPFAVNIRRLDSYTKLARNYPPTLGNSRIEYLHWGVRR